MSDTSTSPLSETVALEEKAFKDFPFPLALVLYSLSWGWSLLRPNTLFWDDWVYIFNQPKSFLNQIFVETGLPPWRALLDQEMIAIGNWTIPWFTFAMYFAAGAFLWEIIKKTNLLTQSQIKFEGSWVNLQNYRAIKFIAFIGPRIDCDNRQRHVQ